MDTLTQINAAINKKEENKNMKLNQEKMKEINGGSITSSMINALSKAVNTLYELGKATGSALRRILHKTYCPMK